MTTITDKLLHPKFTYTTPTIQPTLKNSIYDVKSEQPTKFELTKIKYLDKDYKDTSKAKEFKKAKIDILEDTGVKNISGVSFDEDPFKSFFGFKETQTVPDKFLDGYYKYNLKGMTNETFAKDRLLAGEGNMTDLERRLQNQEEFLELYDRQQGYRDSILDTEDEIIKADYTRAKAHIEKDDRRQGISEDKTRAKLKEKNIEIRKAIRDRHDDMIRDMDYELDDEVKEIKTPNYENKHFGDLEQIDNIAKEINEGKGLKSVRIRGINNIFKKYDLPLMTTAMDDERKNEILQDNFRQIREFLGEKTNKIKQKFRSTKMKAVVDNKRLSENVATAIAKQKAEKEEKKEGILINQAASKIGTKYKKHLAKKLTALPPTPEPATAPPTPMTADDDDDEFRISTALGKLKGTTPTRRQASPPPPKEATPKKGATPAKPVAIAPPPSPSILAPAKQAPTTAGGGAKGTGIPKLKGILKQPASSQVIAQQLPVAPLSLATLTKVINDLKEVITDRTQDEKFTANDVKLMADFNQAFPNTKVSRKTTIKTATQKLTELENQLRLKNLSIPKGAGLQRTPAKGAGGAGGGGRVLG